jgi:hypothetical protein
MESLFSLSACNSNEDYTFIHQDILTKLSPNDFNLGNLVMQSYRLYYLSINDHITSMEVIVADDDDAAKARAELLSVQNHRPVEIWRGPLMVGAYSEHASNRPGAP